MPKTESARVMKNPKFGWTGKILRIDLSLQKYHEVIPEDHVYHNFIGGKGMAGYYLANDVTLNWDDPNMPLLFFAGPLVGTPVPTSGRMTVMSKSPLTGTVGDASVGGKFGTELKKAGWDGIVVAGRSPNGVGIEINDQTVRFVDATQYKGLAVNQVLQKQDFKNVGSVGVVGPAAENGVRFANIIFDGHYAAGRNGLGLVCAAKNLKYISVTGSQKVKVYDRNALAGAREDIDRLISASPVLMGELGISNFGTGALYDLTHSRRMMPTDNFRKTFFEPASHLNAYAYQKQYSPKKAGCRGCAIQCKKIGKNSEILPEFETMNHFSALLNQADISLVVEANAICNNMGMDAISAGATLACYAEIGDQQLTKERILSILTDMGYGRGVGKQLGQGAFRYAQAQGRGDAAMTVKKLELPAYDPRGAYGMALGYAVATRGGCHLRAYPIAMELLRKPVPTDRFTFDGKARIVKISEDINAAVDSLTACKFAFFGASLEEYARAFSAVTGVDMTGQDLLKTGERIYFHERMMNYQNGFDGKDDDLPQRFFTEPGTGSEHIKIPPIPREAFLKARHNYYKIRGADESGAPSEEKAKTLGLTWPV